MATPRSKVVAVMQPYYFPYIGYFELVAASDVFVLYDDAAFSKNGWFNRNRILGRLEAWEYIRMSVSRAPLGTPSSQIRLASQTRDAARTLDLLSVYREAPQYEPVRDLVARIVDAPAASLAEMASRSVQEVSRYLGIQTFFVRSSRVDYARDSSAQEKVIGICRSQGATRYINAPGGAELYDPAAFAAVGIDLRFARLSDFRYLRGRHRFVPDLSIIDVLMWNEVESVREYFDRRGLRGV